LWSDGLVECPSLSRKRPWQRRSLALAGGRSSTKKSPFWRDGEPFHELSTTCTKTQRLSEGSCRIAERRAVELRSTLRLPSAQASRGRLSPQEPLPKGVTAFISSRYNDLVMSTVSDAAQSTQFASARVLAALFSVPAALSGESAFATASQSFR
jgi:hypothetical protein